MASLDLGPRQDQNKEWKELRFFTINSAESERELDKLAQSLKKEENAMEEQDGMQTEWSVMDRSEYLDLIAPIDNTEDFSTA